MAWFEREFNCNIHVLRTDSGKEFKAVDVLCERLGMRRQRSEPYNQASNGKAERMIRNILDFARAMLLASNLPIRFWGDAVLHANYVLIRIPTSANVPRISPYKAAYKKAPYLGDLVPFGAKCTVLVSHKYGRQKKNEPEGSHTWKPRTLEGRILGRNEEAKGYRVYVIKTNHA
jgi:transposase InsO family protein